MCKTVDDFSMIILITQRTWSWFVRKIYEYTYHFKPFDSCSRKYRRGFRKLSVWGECDICREISRRVRRDYEIAFSLETIDAFISILLNGTAETAETARPHAPCIMYLVQFLHCSSRKVSCMYSSSIRRLRSADCRLTKYVGNRVTIFTIEIGSLNLCDRNFNSEITEWSTKMIRQYFKLFKIYLFQLILI